MSYGQITVASNGSTHTLYETCGYDNCTHKLLEAMGIGKERFTDQDEFTVGESTITVEHHLDEQDSCAWCMGCGDFLTHGLSCECAERGHDPEADREPMEPMVDVTGLIELRPFK